MTKQPFLNENIAWLAWERHRRTLELSHYLGITPVIFESSLPRLFKHPFFIVKSFFYLLKKRPIILIVQNPSIVLTLLGCILHRLLGFYFIVDAHNGGIVVDSPTGRKFPFFYTVWQKEADLTIVTNRFMAEIVDKNGGRSFVLPDKLPEGKNHCCPFGVEGRINILCVSTFDADEPFQEVFAAAKKLPEDYLIYMTGAYAKIDDDLPQKCPQQVHLTGFLSEDDYWSLLTSVDLVMDLTFRENCLVCGAYEAVSQKKPLILSNTAMLMEYFNRGAVFTQNDSVSIYHTILSAVRCIEKLKREVEEGHILLKKQWKISGQGLVHILLEKINEINSCKCLGG